MEKKLFFVYPSLRGTSGLIEKEKTGGLQMPNKE